MSNSGGRYIGNPLYEASASAPTSTKTTSKQPPQASGVNPGISGLNPVSGSLFQDISAASNSASANGAASRRQAFSFAYSDNETRLRNRSHLFSLDSPLDSSTSRYLEVPSSYSTDSTSATRFSLDSLGSRENAKLSFRHHSVDSPEHIRRNQFR